MLDLKALSYVLAIAKCGNFSRAAGELGLSQPALTKRVQAMEADFGFRLFDRDRSGVSVTAQAKELIEQAGLLLADATALEQQFRQSGKGKAGNLCFGIAPLPAQAFLHDAMALSLEQTPEVELEATVRSVDALWPMLLAGEIEFFVSASGQIPDNPPVRQQILGKFPYTIIMRSGHALISGRAERARYPLLISSRDKALAALPEALQHLASGIVHSAETFTALSKLLQRSDALWPTSPYAVLDELEAGTLVEYVDGQGEKGAIPVQIPIVIYSLERRSQSALALEMQCTMRVCIGRLAERYQSSRLSR